MRLRSGRSRYSIRKFMSFCLKKVRIEYDLYTMVINIIILGCDLVDFNSTEFSNGSEAFRHDSVGSYLNIRILFDPLFENLTGYERILRHCPDGLSFSSEELGKSLNYITIIIQHHEPYKVHARQTCRKCKVRVNGLSAIVLSIICEPSYEIITFYCRRCRQYKRVALIICLSLIYGIVDHICYCEHILVIFCPYTQLSIAVCFLIDLDIISEITATVYPFRCITILGWHSRYVVKTIVRTDVNCLCSKDCGFIFLIESDCISDRIIIRNDSHIFSRNIRACDPITGHRYLRSLASLNDLAYSPECIIVFTVNGSRHI